MAIIDGFFGERDIHNVISCRRNGIHVAVGIVNAYVPNRFVAPFRHVTEICPKVVILLPVWNSHPAYRSTFLEGRYVRVRFIL